MSHTLFVVDGPSGAGKSHFLRHAENRFEGLRAVPKLTTRPRRENEARDWSDLIHVSTPEFETAMPDLRYRSSGYWYGLRLHELSARFAGCAASALVIRDPDTIRELLERIDDARVVPVLVWAGRETRRPRLLRTGLSPEDVDRRLALDAALDPSADRDLYQELLLNEGSLAKFERAVETLVRSYTGLRSG